jgi:hypothetical protein
VLPPSGRKIALLNPEVDLVSGFRRTFYALPDVDGALTLARSWRYWRCACSGCGESSPRPID